VGADRRPRAVPRRGEALSILPVFDLEESVYEALLWGIEIITTAH